MTNEWRVMNTKEMEKAWKDAGYDFVWTNAESDPAKQLADVEDLLARKPDVLIIAPIEYEALAPVPGLAAKAGVPLLVVDRNLPGKAGTERLDLGHHHRLRRLRHNAPPTTSSPSCRPRRAAPKGNWLHITGNVGASPVIDQGKGMERGLRRPSRHQAARATATAATRARAAANAWKTCCRPSRTASTS